MRGSRIAVNLLGMLVLLAAVAAQAAPAADLSYERRRWTQADGAPQQALALAQTDDGLLWFSSAVGLYSFDGIRFKQASEVYGQAVPPGSISHIARLDEGLAVGYQSGGLSIFSPRGATHYVAGKNFPLGTLMGVAADQDGTLYAATSTGLFRRQGGRWTPYGTDSLPPGVVSAIGFDREHVLWASIYTKQFARRPGADTFVPVAAPDDYYAGITGGDMMARSPEQGFVKLSANAPAQAVRIEQPALYQGFLLPGPQDSLWTYREDGVVRLARRPDGTLYAAELFPNHDKAGGMMTNGLVDREGNFWITTAEGVERYRRHRFHRVATPNDGYQWLAQRGIGEELWFGADNKPVLRLAPDGGVRATPVAMADSILRVAPDHVWVGSRGRLWEFKGGDTRSWPLPAQIRQDYDVQALALDGAGRLLVSILRSGVWRFDNGAWSRDTRLPSMTEPTPLSMLTDRAGRTWLGFTGNRLGVLEAGAMRLLSASAGLRIGNVFSLFETDGKLLVGGDQGVNWVRDGRAYPLRLAQAKSLQRVTGLVTDRLGALWVHGNDGLYRIGAQALQAYWADPAAPVEAELFNFEDGIRGAPAQQRPLPSLSLAHDGRLFYATTSQVGWIDPAAIPRNPRAPAVLIESLSTPTRTYHPRDGLVLPELTSEIELAFTATALTIPERVRIRYKLEGFDADWREVQRERSAQYSHLKPGHYAFRVIAANEDGVWNAQGARFRFEIRPAFWQTWWFQAACVLLLALAGVALYRWRLRVARARSEARALARLEATLQERHRIARALHDNLLQAVHALLLRFQTVQSQLPREPELQAMLDKVMNYAEMLVESTRDEVMALRAEPVSEQLLLRLRESVAAAAPGAEELMQCVTEGRQRPLQGEVCAEMSQVLREAVLNSVRHGRAREIVVTLRFADGAFEGEVRDDGVGIDPDIAARGRAGHWGIAGMRERVAKLDGAFHIGAGAGGGTVVRFAIPAPRAYAAHA